MKFISIGNGNMVAAHRVISIVSPDSAPVRRLVSKAKEDGRTVDATQGRKTKAVLIMENDRIILQKYEPACIFCGSAKGLVSYRRKNICQDCIKRMNEY